jgi:hypothetical protein
MAPYVLDELPLWGDLPGNPHPIYVSIPSLESARFSRRDGATIYGSDRPPRWTVSTTAFHDRTAYEFWMASSVSWIARAFGLVHLTLILSRPVSTSDWIGKVVDLASHGGAEAHFLVYSPALEISLDLHLAMFETRRQVRSKGLDFLGEIRAD